jgi:hypothetical protein
LLLDSELVFEGDPGLIRSIGRRSARASNVHYTPVKWLLIDLDLAYTRARFSDSDPFGNHIPEALARFRPLQPALTSLLPTSSHETPREGSW